MSTSDQPDRAGEVIGTRRRGRVDIRAIGSAAGVWGFSGSDYPLLHSQWGEAFRLLRKLANYRHTAGRAQDIGWAMIEAYDALGDAPSMSEARWEAYITLHALAADAARLARGQS